MKKQRRLKAEGREEIGGVYGLCLLRPVREEAVCWGHEEEGRLDYPQPEKAGGVDRAERGDLEGEKVVESRKRVRIMLTLLPAESRPEQGSRETGRAEGGTPRPWRLQ